MTVSSDAPTKMLAKLAAMTRELEQRADRRSQQRRVEDLQAARDRAELDELWTIVNTEAELAAAEDAGWMSYDDIVRIEGGVRNKDAVRVDVGRARSKDPVATRRRKDGTVLHPTDWLEKRGFLFAPNSQKVDCSPPPNMDRRRRTDA